MGDEPLVQITTEPGIKTQFGNGRFSYQNSAKKVSTPVAVGSFTAVVVAVSAVVLSGNPKKDQNDQVSHFLGVEIPQRIDPAGGILNIPQVDSHANPTLNASSKKGTGRNEITRFSGPQLLNRPRNVAIPPGSLVSATLISGASDGPVKAQLKEPLIIAGETLLDAGTVLVGTGQSGNDRLVIRFHKAVFSDGSMAKVAAEAADAQDKIPGIKGSRVGYRATKLAAGIGLNFVGGMSQALQDTQGQSGTVVAPPTVKNALLNGAARASIEEGQDMMNEYRNEKPVIEVSAGTSIFILFSDTDSN